MTLDRLLECLSYQVLVKRKPKFKKDEFFFASQFPPQLRKRLRPPAGDYADFTSIGPRSFGITTRGGYDSSPSICKGKNCFEILKG